MDREAFAAVEVDEPWLERWSDPAAVVADELAHVPGESLRPTARVA